MAAPARAQVPALQANSARDCAVCHLNWVDSFRRPQQAVLLIDPPGNRVVSESSTCLGCHDGSVGDSRHRVWVQHGHRTGVKPPPDMTVPPQLPLLNGQLACRTCHTAHSGQGPETLATTVFLRMPNDSSQLCQTCHTAQSKGPATGSHPLGDMPWPMPEPLVAAGAREGPAPQRLICQSCHTPHGSSQDNLLVMGTQSSQLCLTCHSKLRPGLWRADAQREHPQNPPLDPAQQQAIKALGTHLGDNNTLICLSCHKLHHGLAGRNMLADTLHDSSLCLRCHPGLKDMFGTRHDLRTSAPNERNRLDQTPVESGPCGACHSFHQFARRPDPEPLDPSGLCDTCHQQGQCAGQATGLPFSHPTDIPKTIKPTRLDIQLYAPRDNPTAKTLACLTCHNPHEVANKHFLRAQPSTLCGACHADTLASLGPAHDFTDHPNLLNGRKQTADQAGKCGFCHAVHNAIGPMMWVATAKPPQSPNDWCLECHSSTGLARDVKVSPLRHPTGQAALMLTPTPDAFAKHSDAHALPPLNKGGSGGVSERLGTPDSPSAPDTPPPLTKGGPQGDTLPLFSPTGQRSQPGSVACATCHDPHGGADHSHNLLRQAPNAGDTTLCATCHSEATTIHAGLHSERFLADHFDDTRFCAPCHAVHEKPGMPPTGTWAAPPGPQGQSPATQRCTGCHSPAGHATPITPTIHPLVPMANVAEPGAPGWMPLYDDNGNPGPTGSIACGTCHLPHGPRDPKDVTVDPAKASARQLRSLRIMVRPYTAPNVCSSCHGFDGLRRYLYYHNPARRGPLPKEAP